MNYLLIGVGSIIAGAILGSVLDVIVAVVR